MSNVPATLFYFATADALKDFHHFEVSQTQVGHDSVPLWTVTGCERSSGPNALIAEFHIEGNADTFRDMCVIVSRS